MKVWCVGEWIEVIQLNENELRGKKGQREMRMKWTQSEMKKERKTIKDSGKRLNVMDVQLKPWYSIINVTQ